MIASALAFSLVASLAVALAGRRETRLAAAALLLLLAIPLLQFLPKWQLLPGPGMEPGSPSPLPLAAWIGGSLFIALRILRSTLTIARWKRRALKVGSVAIDRCREALILQSTDLESPVAAGILKPVIMVPEAWQGWTEETRRIVIAHEVAHHARRDPLWRLLGLLACAIHWFNPLVWWLARRQRLDAEFDCDARVVGSGIPASHYASVLCDLAATRATPAAAIAMAEESLLRGRVRRLVQPVREFPPLIAGILLCAVVAAAVALSLIGREEPSPTVPAGEVRLRLSASPFPGN